MFKDILNEAINEGSNLQELKSLTKKVKDILRDIEKEASASSKKDTSETDKNKAAYSMMNKLKEIDPIVRELDELLNMKW
jgi:hypothetical protein